MRIAVVDGYSTGKLVAQLLKSRGVSCIHVQSQPSTHPYYRRTFVESDYDHDLGYQQATDQVAHALIELGVDRVVAGTESGVDLAAKLGAVVGGPHNDPARSAASSDKELMAKLAQQAGIPMPAGASFDNPDDAVAWVEAAGFDQTVAKPTTSAGTDNVQFCDNTEQLHAACKKILSSDNVYGEPNLSVTVQQRVSGIEYYFNTVSLDGTHRVAEAWRYCKRVTDSGAPIYDYEQPVETGSPEWAQLRSFIFGCLDALGISSSPAHTEVMLTAGGQPILIETGARLGGATLPALVEQLFGHSQASLTLESMLDPNALAGFDDRSIGSSQAVRNVSLINEIPGVVRSARWREQIEQLPSFAALVSPLQVGDELERTSNLIDSPGYLYLAAQEPAEVERDYQSLRSWERNGLYTR